MNHWTDLVSDALGLGLEARDLSVTHMSFRAILIYVVVLALIRLGHKRFLGRSTAFDFILAILLGSVASRAITGNAPLFPVIAACAVLIFMHSFFAWLSFRWHPFGLLVKGKPIVLIQDGKMVQEGMRRTYTTEHDLMEALRTHASSNDASHIQLSQLERSGNISAISRSSNPKVVTVSVADGVQTVRIELS
jgi:uncharacterized membrane protein YcaP (DUF421 family)